ncbi:hypothetical protein JKP88DRAFT_255471 [Tribonema minus]|uniref:Uncharacterized protein n=1 Tax=Tribonema minus TaxID=303371 RepID=A0A836CGA7_9STRA|nr:hypothetical protein JKP88DRAFT_255471 [Tribonema minus]
MAVEQLQWHDSPTALKAIAAAAAQAMTALPPQKRAGFVASTLEAGIRKAEQLVDRGGHGDTDVSSDKEMAVSLDDQPHAGATADGATAAATALVLGLATPLIDQLASEQTATATPQCPLQELLPVEHVASITALAVGFLLAALNVLWPPCSDMNNDGGRAHANSSAGRGTGDASATGGSYGAASASIDSAISGGAPGSGSVAVAGNKDGSGVSAVCALLLKAVNLDNLLSYPYAAAHMGSASVPQSPGDVAAQHQMSNAEPAMTELERQALGLGQEPSLPLPSPHYLHLEATLRLLLLALARAPDANLRAQGRRAALTLIAAAKSSKARLQGLMRLIRTCPLANVRAFLVDAMRGEIAKAVQRRVAGKPAGHPFLSHSVGAFCWELLDALVVQAHAATTLHSPDGRGPGKAHDEHAANELLEGMDAHLALLNLWNPVFEA